MWGQATSSVLASRFARLVEQLGGDSVGARQRGQQRALLAAIDEAAPATLGVVAAAVGRGAPAVSRAVEALVKAGLVERQADPANRRQLALRLTKAGHDALTSPPPSDGVLEERLGKLASSELRALERGIEILERLPR